MKALKEWETLDFEKRFPDEARRFEAWYATQPHRGAGALTRKSAREGWLEALFYVMDKNESQ